MFHTYGVCLHLIYPIYLLLLYSYIYFFLSIISLLYYLILYIYLFFTRRVLHTYGLGLHLILSLYILSLFTLFFLYYTRSIRPSSMAHIPPLLPVGVPHLRGFYTSLSTNIYIFYIVFLFSLCTIPYLSVLPLLHTFLIFILYCLHILHTSSTRRVTPTGYLLSIRDVSFLSHLFIYTSFIHIFTLLLTYTFCY